LSRRKLSPAFCKTSGIRHSCTILSVRNIVFVVNLVMDLDYANDVVPFFSQSAQYVDALRTMEQESARLSLCILWISTKV